MTYPRSHLVDPDGGVYHVCSRCVRRAFLCGVDRQTGYNFDHRRKWIEDRLLDLSGHFALEIYGYAVMSNHYHIVLRMKPSETARWTDQSVADKWIALNPHRADDSDTRESRKLALLEDPQRVKIIRQRLGSLSWFMRYLNEPLARLANKEDGCKGRFWEGRFKSQRLLDDTAILACMVYIDLNPVRAGLCEDALNAEHTSLARRIKKTENGLGERLCALNNQTSFLSSNYSLKSYIELVAWTMDVQKFRKQIHARIRGIPPPEVWTNNYLPAPGRWRRAIGSVGAMKDYAESIGQKWIQSSSLNLTVQF